MILTSPTVVWGPEGCSPGVFYSQGNKDLPIKTRFSYSKYRFQPHHPPLLPSASCVLQLVILIGNWLFPGFLPPLNHKAREGTHVVSTPAHASSTVKCPNYLRLMTRAIGVERKERSVSWSHSLTIRSSDEIWKMSKIIYLRGWVMAFQGSNVINQNMEVGLKILYLWETGWTARKFRKEGRISRVVLASPGLECGSAGLGRAPRGTAPWCLSVLELEGASRSLARWGRHQFFLPLTFHLSLPLVVLLQSP